MKIAIISPGPFSVPPVIGTSVEHDIQMVAEQMEQNHKVTVYTRKCPEYPRSKREGDLYYKRFNYSNSNRYLRKVIRHIKKHMPDIIMVENRPLYLLRIKKQFRDIPIVLNMHSMLFVSRPYINRKQMNQVADKADALITNSQYLLSQYVRQFPRFNGKAHAVYLGINQEPFEQAGDQKEEIEKLKKKYRIQEGDLTLLFVGRLKKEKGIHLILKVMPKLIKKYPNLKLVITGASRYGKNLMTPYVRRIYRQTAKFHKHVVFTKFILPYKIPYIYRLADIVVIPSLWQEPFGRVNLEAMASSRAIVASNQGGIPEVVRHEENGLVFSIQNYKEELYDSFSKLLNSKELCEKYGQNGLASIKEFTWSKTAKQYLGIYEELLNKEKQ